MNNFEWLNKNSKKFLKSGYLQEGVEPKERIKEIADHSEKILGIKGFSDKFYDYMSKGYYSLASPIWSNFGKERGLPISCFGSNIADNTGDIVYTLAEVGMMAKLGGGCSGYFGNLRERGASIKNNGTSSGSVHFMNPFNTLMDTISQGQVRRGFFSPTLPIDHPDINEFLEIGSEGNPIQLLVHGVSVKDYWMREMIDGDRKKRRVWAKVLKSRAEIGYPYIMFEDTANKYTVEVYKEKKRILASNMCFTGDTIVAVADGRNGITIKQLAKESKHVNKFPVFSAREKATSSKQFKTEVKNAVAFSNGIKKVVKLTLNNGDTFRCTSDHRLAKINGGYVEAGKSLNIELSSFFSFKNDNQTKPRYVNSKTNYPQHKMLYEFKNGEIKEGYELDHIDNNIELIDNRKGLYVVNIEDAGEEEVFDLTVEDNNNFYILTSGEEDFGNSNGILVHNCQEIMLPSDEFWSFVCCLSSMNLLYFDHWKNTDAIETLVYFLEAVMEDFIKKLEAYRDSELLEDKRTFMFMKKAYDFAVDNRALGLGALGWHSYLQSKMLAFDSDEAMSLNSKIFKLIKEKSYKASEELAKLFGEPKVLKGIGRRHSTLNAVAPTTSSAFILEQVSQSIEPWWSNSYVKDIAKIKITIDNIYLKELLKSKNKNTRKVWLDIRKHDGSVQHLDFLTDHEKNVFKTFSEIDQEIIIYQAANRQNHIDQGQSLNLMIHPDMPTRSVNKLYILAWKMGIKSLYYQHSINAAQQFKQKKECSSCEG